MKTFIYIIIFYLVGFSDSKNKTVTEKNLTALLICLSITMAIGMVAFEAGQTVGRYFS